MELRGDTVIFGATMRLLDVESDETVTYQIVGVDEADVQEGKLSLSSPMARAAIGKEIGDVVQVKTPKGIMEYEIDDVEYI